MSIEENQSSIHPNGTKFFPGAAVAEVGSVQMLDVVGDYNVPDEVPEWGWVEKVACFSHRHNGQDGVWEFVVNLSALYDNKGNLVPVPVRLRPVLAEAHKKGLSYLIFHQGT